MKKVLITGKNSYVGEALAARLARSPGEYEVDSVGIRDLAWKNYSFAPYDVIFHVAGIVHQAKAPDALFQSVNRDLAIEIAAKAKSEGVGKFILMSTMAVYGANGAIGKPCVIDADSPLKPDTPYGRSKLEAEAGVIAAADPRFKVCVIRAPMIYGGGCEGNYRLLRSFVFRFGLIPHIANERSMIYIGNFCEYARLLIDRDLSGIFCPRDIEPFRTAEVMEWIAEENGIKYRKSGLLGACVKPGALVLPVLRKAFGNLTYDPALSVIPLEEYCQWRLRDAIRETEAGFKEIEEATHV